MPGHETGVDEKQAVAVHPAITGPASDGGDDAHALEQVTTNNVRPACFSSTLQEVLFVLTATMAIASEYILPLARCSEAALAGDLKLAFYATKIYANDLIPSIVVGALLTGSVTVVSSFIGRDLNMTTAEITWISSATSLSSGAFLLFFGKVADLFGKVLV